MKKSLLATLCLSVLILAPACRKERKDRPYRHPRKEYSRRYYPENNRRNVKDVRGERIEIEEIDDDMNEIEYRKKNMMNNGNKKMEASKKEGMQKAKKEVNNY